MNKYMELRSRQQKEVNALPLGFAFNESQFDEMMKGWGLSPKKDLDKIVSIGAGGFIQKKDRSLLHETFDRHKREMKEAIDSDPTGEGFIFDMFLCELDNHEYGYTGDTTDALEALGFTAKEVVDDPRLNRGICKAHQVIMGRDEYSQVFNGYHLSLSQNDYYNDPERYPEKVIRVRFDGIEEGTGREVYQGLDTGRYYLREVSRREKFARWLVCGKRRHQDDGDEPRANLVFEFNGHRERVRYDDWNGVAAYSDTFNPEFSKAAVKRSGSSEDFSGA